MRVSYNGLLHYLAKVVMAVQFRSPAHYKSSRKRAFVFNYNTQKAPEGASWVRFTILSLTACYQGKIT